MKLVRQLSVIVVLAVAAVTTCAGQSNLAPTDAQVISPEELVKLLQSSQAEKPLILSVGPRLLYEQAHIPGAEYVGAAADAQGLALLRTRVKPVAHSTAIVLYCGCCPWTHCPNVHPAYDALHAMGFSHVRVLYIAQNFGTDWVDKGYPTVKGQ